jgi:hypothetical protein
VGLIAWLDLEVPDVAAYIISDIIGSIVYLFLRQTTGLALEVSILLSFHLFLAWLVITSHRNGLSLSIISTILTHLACLAAVFFCSSALSEVSRLGHSIPIYAFLIIRPIRYILDLCIPGLAVFERAWLFSESKSKPEVPVTAKSAAIAADREAAAAAATREDYEAWLAYVARRNPSSVKLGMTLKDEYEEWMVARVKNRPPAAHPNAAPRTGGAA